MTQNTLSLTWLADEFSGALRGICRNAATTAAIIAILGIGMGVNLAVFSIVDPLLLHNLPIREPGQIVLLHSSGSHGAIEISELSTFQLYDRDSPVFEGIFAVAPLSSLSMDSKGLQSVVKVQGVSDNFFGVLGIRPHVGRLFELSDRQGLLPAVVSYDYWISSLGGSPAVIGQTVSLDGTVYTVVGVASKGFFGLNLDASPDIYVQLTSLAPYKGPDSASQWVNVFGRLKAGSTIKSATEYLEPLFQQSRSRSSLPSVERDEVMQRLVVTSAARGLSDLRTKVSQPIRLTMIIVGVVLFLACINVAGLLVIRAISRQREIAIRLALGSSRGRIFTRTLLESGLLVCLALITGGFVGRYFSKALIALLGSKGFPFRVEPLFNWRLLTFGGCWAAVIVLVSGLAPAYLGSRAILSAQLKVYSGAFARGSGSSFRRGLIMVQTAISVMLLIVATLLARTLIHVQRDEVGFDRDQVVEVSLLSKEPGRTGEQNQQFYSTLLSRANALPGVRSSAVSSFAPISARELGINVRPEEADSPSRPVHASFVSVTPLYFASIGIPLLQGRDFDNSDGRNSPPSVIINRKLATDLFANQDVLHRKIRFVEGNRPPMEIVGVVADSTYSSMRESPQDFLYLDRLQGMPPSTINATLIVRMAGTSRQQLEKPLRSLVEDLAPSVEVISVRTLREQIDASFYIERIVALLCGAFSILSIAVTCVGLYSTLSYTVARRTSEIGLRISLGAQRAQIFRMFVGEAVALTISGVLMGWLLSFLVTPSVDPLLFRVKRGDPMSFLLAALTLVAIAAVSALVPALRATAIDPMVALRNE